MAATDELRAANRFCMYPERAPASPNEGISPDSVTWFRAWSSLAAFSKVSALIYTGAVQSTFENLPGRMFRVHWLNQLQHRWHRPLRDTQHARTAHQVRRGGLGGDNNLPEATTRAQKEGGSTWSGKPRGSPARAHRGPEKNAAGHPSLL
jgi:hypothetical protein